MSIKQMIIKLCDGMIIFWTKLRDETVIIPDEDNVGILNKWLSFFEDNYETIGEFSDVKTCINNYVSLCDRDWED